MPVLTLCLTTVGSFAILFLSAKIIGHKQIPPRWPPSWRSPGNL